MIGVLMSNRIGTRGWNGTNLYGLEQARYFLERLKALGDKRFEKLYTFLEEFRGIGDGFLIEGSQP